MSNNTIDTLLDTLEASSLNVRQLRQIFTIVGFPADIFFDEGGKELTDRLHLINSVRSQRHSIQKKNDKVLSIILGRLSTVPKVENASDEMYSSESELDRESDIFDDDIDTMHPDTMHPGTMYPDTTQPSESASDDDEPEFSLPMSPSLPTSVTTPSILNGKIGQMAKEKASQQADKVRAKAKEKAEDMVRQTAKKGRDAVAEYGAAATTIAAKTAKASKNLTTQAASVAVNVQSSAVHKGARAAQVVASSIRQHPSLARKAGVMTMAIVAIAYLSHKHDSNLKKRKLEELEIILKNVSQTDMVANVTRKTYDGSLEGYDENLHSVLHNNTNICALRKKLLQQEEGNLPAMCLIRKTGEVRKSANEIALAIKHFEYKSKSKSKSSDVAPSPSQPPKKAPATTTTRRRKASPAQRSPPKRAKSSRRQKASRRAATPPKKDELHSP